MFPAVDIVERGYLSGSASYGFEIMVLCHPSESLATGFSPSLLIRFQWLRNLALLQLRLIESLPYLRLESVATL
jgi:hypothetical protein